MTPQEIINEVQKLPLIQQREVLDHFSIDQNIPETHDEIEVARRLLANGIITAIPENWNEPDDAFQPIAIIGKPLSTTIIEDRG